MELAEAHPVVKRRQNMDNMMEYINGYAKLVATPAPLPVAPNGQFVDPNQALNKWSYAVQPDGTYKEPSSFMEEFAQHMHRNVYNAL